MRYSAYIKKKLLSLIEQMETQRWLYTRNPGKDFSRVKKWSFGEMIRFIISMEGNALGDELLKYFDYSADTPTNSSFNQRRAQILPEAFEYLFHEFTGIAVEEKLYHGYRLLACDGSDLSIAHNPQDETTYFQSTPDSKGFNQVHLNALYDLQTRSYVDAIIQPARQENENKALCTMIDRYHGDAKALFIADRGYQSYNIFAHVQEKGMYYLIRAKDILKQGIVSAAKGQLPSWESFDATVNITLTNKQTKEILANPVRYRIVMSNQHFDFLSDFLVRERIQHRNGAAGISVRRITGTGQRVRREAIPKTIDDPCLICRLNDPVVESNGHVVLAVLCHGTDRTGQQRKTAFPAKHLTLCVYRSIGSKRVHIELNCFPCFPVVMRSVPRRFGTRAGQGVSAGKAVAFWTDLAV